MTRQTGSSGLPFFTYLITKTTLAERAANACKGEVNYGATRQYPGRVYLGDTLVYLALGVGLYFTIITRAVQFRYFFEMMRLLRERKESADGISSFQAFCMALSGRVGVGNIAG